jgi:MarR family
MASTDLLSKICDELDARLRELRPLIDEYESLLDAAAALEHASGEVGAASGGAPIRVSAPSTETASVSGAAPARRRGRPPGKRNLVRSAAEPALEASADANAETGSNPRAAEQPAARRSAAAPKRAQRGAAAVAILAALEHGSHTVSELAIVTALSGAIINNNLRRLQQAGTITRTKREGDGKAAYALTVTPA